jgi:hypothetical protein
VTDPEVRRNRIVIVGQRFIANKAGATIRQTLELDLEVGSAIEPVMCHVDIKLGAVKKYSDELSE